MYFVDSKYYCELESKIDIHEHEISAENIKREHENMNNVEGIFY